MSRVIVRHVKSLPISPGPHTCVHVAHIMRCLNKNMGGREGGREGGRGGEGVKTIATGSRLPSSLLSFLPPSLLQAKVLMKGVDDVTLGMGSPADTLLISAKSGDPGLLAEQSKAISYLASSMQDIVQDAVEG